MDGRAGRRPRWAQRRIGLTLPLGDAETRDPAAVVAVWDLRTGAGELVGHALVVVDVRGKRGTVDSIRYDTSKATEAEAMEALERLLRARQ
jgi:hypothetical protein